MSEESEIISCSILITLYIISDLPFHCLPLFSKEESVIIQKNTEVTIMVLTQHLCSMSHEVKLHLYDYTIQQLFHVGP